MTKKSSLLSFEFLFAFFFGLSITAMAEEMLIKKEAKYLGWQTAKDEFTTCSKNVIKIGDGRIEKTDEKCEEPQPPAPAAPAPPIAPQPPAMAPPAPVLPTHRLGK